MKIKEITDIKEIIQEINDIESTYRSGNYESEKLLNRIIQISDPIISCDLVDKDTLSGYSQTCVTIADKIKNGIQMSSDDMSKWLEYSEASLAIAFIKMAVKMLNNSTFSCINDKELADLLLNYFIGDHLVFVAAHYQASRLLARIDPLKCYENTLNDYKKIPDLAKHIYGGISYTYDPESVKDEINKTCPICGSDLSEPFYCSDQALRDNSSFSPAKLWMKCGGCGNLYAYNFPVWNMGEINGRYTVSNQGSLLKPIFRLALYSDIFNRIKQYNKGNKYLEVGVGSGEMMSVALEMGYDVSAVDICREDCEKVSGALGVDIVWSDFLKFNTDRKFDVIIMGDIIEHVSKPVDALQKAYDLLNDSGVLWLSTPNFNSSFTRMRKFDDPMWNEKNHFTYFSYEGFEPFLKKVGFEVRRYDVSERYNGSMELILQK